MPGCGVQDRTRRARCGIRWELEPFETLESTGARWEGGRGGADQP